MKGRKGRGKKEKKSGHKITGKVRSNATYMGILRRQGIKAGSANWWAATLSAVPLTHNKILKT